MSATGGSLVSSPGEFPYTWFWHVLGSVWAALLPLSQNSYLHTGLYSRKGKGSVLSAHMSSHPRVPVITLRGSKPSPGPTACSGCPAGEGQSGDSGQGQLSPGPVLLSTGLCWLWTGEARQGERPVRRLERVLLPSLPVGTWFGTWGPF